MFEKALKGGYRYASTKGSVSTEDLYRFKLTDLNAVAKILSKEIKDAGEEDFINIKTTESSLLSDKLEIVKYIIKDKLDAQEAAANAVAKRAKRNELLDLISRKESEALAGKSVEQLRAELDALEA